MLSPGNPQELLAGSPLITTIEIADDLHGAIEMGITPEVRLNIQMENLPSFEMLSAKLNGVSLVPLTCSTLKGDG